MNQRPKEILIKSLLTSLFQREELPLFGKEGRGEIFRQLCPFNYGLLSNMKKSTIAQVAQKCPNARPPKS